MQRRVGLCALGSGACSLPHRLMPNLRRRARARVHAPPNRQPEFVESCARARPPARAALRELTPRHLALRGWTVAPQASKPMLVYGQRLPPDMAMCAAGRRVYVHPDFFSRARARVREPSPFDCAKRQASVSLADGLATGGSLAALP